MNKIKLISLVYTLSTSLVYAEPPSVPNDTTSVLNCQYHPTINTKNIPLDLVKSWAAKAATQSFEFGHENFKTQLEQLRPCYTEQGWVGFYAALVKSGNTTAIAAQKLTATSQVNGIPHIQPLQQNQWRVIVPLQVVYQNEKERFTQRLVATLRVVLQPSGQFGIVQLVAVPKG